MILHNIVYLIDPFPLAKLTPDSCSRQIPVELLHWVVENLVGVGEDDLGGALGDSRLRGRGWALFARLCAVLHRRRRGWPLGLLFHELSSTEDAGRMERAA